MRKISKMFITLYFFLLLVHLFHIFEEIFGDSYFIEGVYGGVLTFFLIQFFLFLIPLILLIFILQKNVLACKIAWTYPAFMLLDGADHVIEYFLIQEAGGIFTGIIFVPLSLIMLIEFVRTQQLPGN